MSLVIDLKCKQLNVVPVTSSSACAGVVAGRMCPSDVTQLLRRRVVCARRNRNSIVLNGATTAAFMCRNPIVRIPTRLQKVHTIHVVIPRANFKCRVHLKLELV